MNSLHTRLRNRPAPDCMPIPQGKGREEEWKGEMRTHHPLLTTVRRTPTPVAAVDTHPGMDGATRWGGEW